MAEATARRETSAREIQGRDADGRGPGGGREFAFDRRHFDRIAQLIYRLAGISLAPHKMEMVYARLARRLRELRLPDFDSYCDMLGTEAGEAEIGMLVNALTTNLTAFFRESHHFEFLRDKVLPDVRRRNEAGGGRRLRIWSAGCSSGQEPYTIAMVVSAALSDLRSWDARILATDIDTRMVDTAKAGHYSEEVLGTIPAPLRERNAKRGRDGQIVMADELKRLITFKPLNLLESWPMRGPFDAIFCRNVLIYFDRAGRQHVINKFADLLPHDGYLFLGHSESLYGVSNRFEQVGATIYRKL
jgi:chemotaxis protein methyltransferase CheR